MHAAHAARYDHPKGIALNRQDADGIGLGIEC